jgi:hypothetical protein
MNRIWMFLISLLIFSCSSQPAPAWQSDSFVSMNNMIRSYLEGNDRFAQNYYEKFILNLEKTTDPDEIVKGHLIKCSLDFSLMNYRTCSEAEPFIPILKNEENLIFYNFISGKSSKTPEKYEKVAKYSSPCELSSINKEIKKFDEPLSKLIASSFAVKSGCYDDITLKNAIDTASAEGWKKASIRYLEFAADHFEKNGKNDKAENLRKRIRFTNDKDQ